MTALFLRKKEIAAALNMSQRQAVAILAAHGVKPVDLGKGRGHGLRWRTSAVKQVADALHAEAQAAKAKRRSPGHGKPLQGRSAAELFAEFNRGPSPVQ